MGATIEYDDDGSVDHDHDKIAEEREQREEQAQDLARTEHGGTVDTAADSGQSAATISPVFAEADQFFAETDMPEGVAYAPYVDPANEGEDAAVPDFANADERGRLVNEDGDIIDHTGTVVGNVNDEPVQGAPESAEMGAVGSTEAGGATGINAVDADEAEAQGEEFNPDNHTVAEVNNYLSDASDEERERVLEAERAGQNRSTIVGKS